MGLRVLSTGQSQLPGRLFYLFFKIFFKFFAPFILKIDLYSMLNFVFPKLLA